MAQDILIVDDEADIRDLISGILSDEGYTTRTASDGLAALDMIKARQPNLVILDVWLGDSERDGLKILDIIKRDHSYVPVVMISGHGTIETAVSAIKKGAYDFIEKPFQTERLLVVVERAIESSRLKRENDELRVKARVSSSLIGNSSSIQQLRQALEKISATNGRVFMSGPNGADKEALAREIHVRSKRERGPFLSINCGAYHPQQLEAELFGTEIFGLSADTPRKIGLLEKAHTGTVFLDEIAQLPLPVQSKIVKVLQEQAFFRIGSDQKIDIDIRFLAGTSDDIQKMIQEGNFREDLFYRLSVSHILVPTLKERVTDIPLLAQNFMEQAAAAQGVLPRSFSQEALVMLQSYSWPGDLQQLKNVVDWLLIMAGGDPREPIQSSQLPTEIINGNNFANSWQQKSADIVVLPLREAREAFEREYLLTQVQRFSGNISQTARFIGMERSALHRKLRALGVHEGKSGEFSDEEASQIA
ncbi:MAG: sigma-54 dependent transcriptional regulator [Alphaproteobacteria bacterium]|jgi:two-component system nitrogen regulation response regulator NtrX|nr:sigma-54 dependent transcriptional regulator [Alphaproteobacteria bacterium]